MLRRALLATAASDQVRGLLTGSHAARAIVARYVAGDNAGDAVRVARELRAAGLLVTLDYLGEDTTDAMRAAAVATEYVTLLEKLHAEGLTADGAVEVSVKPTAVGLLLSSGGTPPRTPRGMPDEGPSVSGMRSSGGTNGVPPRTPRGMPDEGPSVSGMRSSGGTQPGEEIAAGHIERIAAAAQAAGTTVTIDAEDHRTTDAALRMGARLRERYPGVGNVVQASLRRTESDVRALAAPGTRVRLCKGAYSEPLSEAFTDAHEIDKSFARSLRVLMEGPGYPMIATHDPRLLRIAAALGLSRAPGSLEYQMLYGIRADEQARLAASGARVRVYVPYGSDWYGYLVRRLAERPASLGLLLRSLYPLGGARRPPRPPALTPSRRNFRLPGGTRRFALGSRAVRLNARSFASRATRRTSRKGRHAS